MDDDDDFGGFEVAETEPDLTEDADDSLLSDSNVTPDVSAIPWLAASIQASSKEMPPSVDNKSTVKESSFNAFTEISTPGAIDWSGQGKFEKELPAPLLPPRADNSRVKELQSQLQTALEEKQKYRSESTELKLKNEEYSRSVERLEAELVQQKKAYDQVQVRHKSELESLKESNQKSIAVIIEEYKEAMKVGIVEQQQSCTRVFAELMEKEAARFEKVLDNQTKSYETWKTEFSTQLNQKHEKSLDALKQDLEIGDLEAQAKEERKTLKSKCEADLEVSKEKLSVMKSESLQEVQTCLASKMAELQLQCKTLVGDAAEELKESMKSQFTQVADDQKSISMDYWEKHSSDMMTGLQATLETTMQLHKDKIDTYVTERVQSEKEAQRKHLSAISVYLEAASQHISTLNDS